jgi:hypothetical protein
MCCYLSNVHPITSLSTSPSLSLSLYLSLSLSTSLSLPLPLSLSLSLYLSVSLSLPLPLYLSLSLSLYLSLSLSLSLPLSLSISTLQPHTPHNTNLYRAVKISLTLYTHLVIPITLSLPHSLPPSPHQSLPNPHLPPIIQTDHKSSNSPLKRETLVPPPGIWNREALPVAKVSIGNGILHVRGNVSVVQVAVSVAGWVEILDMRMLPARTLILRAALPPEEQEPRIRKSEESGADTHTHIHTYSHTHIHTRTHTHTLQTHTLKLIHP